MERFPEIYHHKLIILNSPEISNLWFNIGLCLMGIIGITFFILYLKILKNEIENE